MAISLFGYFFKKTKMSVWEWLVFFLPMWPFFVLETLFWRHIFWIVDERAKIEKRMKKLPDYNAGWVEFCKKVEA